MEFISELWSFMRERKKFWLLPIFLVMALFGGAGRLDPGKRGRALHLHDLLIRRAHSRHLGVLSRFRRGRWSRRGQVAAAAQEERFTRRKHDSDFPQNAIDYCLREAGTTLDEVDFVAFYDKPFLKFERLLETYLVLRAAAASARSAWRCRCG